jgi:hypothetical protein
MRQARQGVVLVAIAPRLDRHPGKRDNRQRGSAAEFFKAPRSIPSGWTVG